MCANLSAEELVPMVYSNWTKEYRNNTAVPDSTSWPNKYNLSLPEPYIHTVVDDLFGFDDSQVHPVFPKLPLPFNTVLNASSVFGSYSIYILAASQDSTYTLCSLRAALTPNCSTQYHASMSGDTLSTRCEDRDDRLAYSRSNPNATNGMWKKDWKDIASEWAMALSLGAGISDGAASNARLISQMTPKNASLDPSLPSISEALAVLAGNTLLLSAIDSPFIHYWNYSDEVPALKDPQYQAFKASFSALTYQSGGTQAWQNIFFVVLILIFVANLCCLSYFIISSGLMTDFMEPQNLFCISLLSPPSQAIEGSCGGGPVKEHFSAQWNIKIDRLREHLWFESSGSSKPGMWKHWKKESAPTKNMDYEMGTTPLGRAYSRIRKNRTSIL